MARTKLDQVLHNNGVWNSVSQLNNVVDNYTRNNSLYNAYQTQSRTLRDTLNYTLGGFGEGNTFYRTFATMYNLITKSNLKIYTGYRLITSDEADNINIYQLLNNTATIPNTTAIYLWHIPKGKSYLRKALDEAEGLNRLKQIEVLCIENQQHFIRVYKGYPGTAPNSIVIFSDMYTTKTIQTLFIMLANILDINPTIAENTELTKEEQLQNTRITMFRAISTILYDVYKAEAQLALYPPFELTKFTEPIKGIIKEFTETFDFVSEQLNSFVQRLAKARNDNAQSYFTGIVNNANCKIRQLENDLQMQYVAKYNAERELAANKHITEDDVKPFIDTIKNTKAIEIVRTTPMEMVLRITAPLQYFTPEDFVSYEKNTTSNYMQMFRNEPYIKKILHKIFVTREYQMLVQSVITIRINDSYSTAPLSCNASNNQTDYTHFPNPHLYHHNCWSAARAEMNKNMCAGNFELVVMQMVAATQTINVAENASFVNGLLNDLNNNRLQRCLRIVDEKGNNCTWTEIIKHEQDLEKEIAIQTALHTIEENKQEYTQVEIPDDDSNWETIVTNVGPNPEHTYENFEEGEDEDEED